MGRVSPLQPTKGSGERRELPQRGPGRSPGRKRILAYFEGHRTLIFVPIWQNLGGGQFALASPLRSKFWRGTCPPCPPWSTPMIVSQCARRLSCRLYYCTGPIASHHQAGPLQLASCWYYSISARPTSVRAKCRRLTRLLTLDVRARDSTASGAALATRPGANPVPAVCSGISLCARHSTGVFGWQPAADIRGCCSSTLLRCWCRQPVDQLSVTARFLWLPHKRGTVCHHRPGPPPRYWHFGGRPSLIFSVSHLADRSLALSLLIDSKTVSTRHATLSVLFVKCPRNCCLVILSLKSIIIIVIVIRYSTVCPSLYYARCSLCRMPLYDWSLALDVVITRIPLASYGDRTFAAPGSGTSLVELFRSSCAITDITYRLFRRQLNGHLCRQAWTLPAWWSVGQWRSAQTATCAVEWRANARVANYNYNYYYWFKWHHDCTVTSDMRRLRNR